MKKFILLAILSLPFLNHTSAQVPVKPAHVILVMEENYAYSEIIGSALAPTFTALSKTSYTANFTEDFAITHPSEPNYIDLFSGNNQGVTADESGPAPNAPFNDCNLGSSLIQAEYSFIGYSENQPSIGWISGDAPPYYTKHCPWINWIGYNGNPDTIPLKSDLPYTSFPDSNNYNSLPTVCWVIPNSVDDMHDGSESSAIPNGDNWFHKNMMPLVRWASNPANNTIVITTWDEDDGNHGNNIPLLVSGGMVNGGNYSTTLNHYNLLKTIEDMYGLTACGSSSGEADLPVAIWNTSAGVSSMDKANNGLLTWPVPANNELNVKITSPVESNAQLSVYNVMSQLIKETPLELKSGENTIAINTADMVNGVYIITVTGNNMNLHSKITVAR